MQRGRSGLQGGSGGDSIAFAPMAAGEIEGVRLATKICELCGKVFLRRQNERDCQACLRRVTAVDAEPAPRAEIVVPKARRGTKLCMTPEQQAMWEAWLAEHPEKALRPIGAPKPVVLTGDGRMERTATRGPRLVLTPEERKRRRDAWRREYLAQKRQANQIAYLRQAAVPAARETVH